MKTLYLRLGIVLCIGLSVLPMRAAVQPSGTLPVMYINTKNKQTVTLDNAIDATLYVTAYGNYPATGSASKPIPLTIKGRGNWTWKGFDKKPYKIVFAQGYGQKLLGMKKSKHWALLAGADDYLGFLKNTTGYSISEHIGLPYTPHQVPVELVLNGEYMGLYFVTETIRIDNDRVNIHEQQDGETNASTITGGWLVEIDNYAGEEQVRMTEPNGTDIMVSMHSPENLSAAQSAYITAQMNTLNETIYGFSGKDLDEVIDIDDAARFYLVQEIMEDCESYHGSCYLYKDRDSTDLQGRPVVPKWHFGPVWDFGNAFDRRQEMYIYEQPTFSQVWIGQMMTHTLFQQRVMQYWYRFRQSGYEEVKADIRTFVTTITSAARTDDLRWHGTNVRTNGDMAARQQEFLNRLEWRMNWLYTQWGEGDSTPIPNVTTDMQQPAAATKVLRNGELIIERNGQCYRITGVPVR